jgi:hypothetical protein
VAFSEVTTTLTNPAADPVGLHDRETVDRGVTQKVAVVFVAERPNPSLTVVDAGAATPTKSPTEAPAITDADSTPDIAIDSPRPSAADRGDNPKSRTDRDALDG